MMISTRRLASVAVIWGWAGLWAGPVAAQIVERPPTLTIPTVSSPATPTDPQCDGKPDGAPCADQNVCNGTETCQAGICATGAPLHCDDGNMCNGAETCDGIVGCKAGTPPDTDQDGKPNCQDNCPDVSNPEQADSNRNGIGDACEVANVTATPTVTRDVVATAPIVPAFITQVLTRDVATTSTAPVVTATATDTTSTRTSTNATTTPPAETATVRESAPVVAATTPTVTRDVVASAATTPAITRATTPTTTDTIVRDSAPVVAATTPTVTRDVVASTATTPAITRDTTPTTTDTIVRDTTVVATTPTVTRDVVASAATTPAVTRDVVIAAPSVARDSIISAIPAPTIDTVNVRTSGISDDAAVTATPVAPATHTPEIARDVVAVSPPSTRVTSNTNVVPSAARDIANSPSITGAGLTDLARQNATTPNTSDAPATTRGTTAPPTTDTAGRNAAAPEIIAAEVADRGTPTTAHASSATDTHHAAHGTDTAAAAMASATTSTDARVTTTATTAVATPTVGQCQSTIFDCDKTRGLVLDMHQPVAFTGCNGHCVFVADGGIETNSLAAISLPSLLQSEEPAHEVCTLSEKIRITDAVVHDQQMIFTTADGYFSAAITQQPFAARTDPNAGCQIQLTPIPIDRGSCVGTTRVVLNDRDVTRDGVTDIVGVVTCQEKSQGSIGIDILSPQADGSMHASFQRPIQNAQPLQWKSMDAVLDTTSDGTPELLITANARGASAATQQYHCAIRSDETSAAHVLCDQPVVIAAGTPIAHFHWKGASDHPIWLSDDGTMCENAADKKGVHALPVCHVSKQSGGAHAARAMLGGHFEPKEREQWNRADVIATDETSLRITRLTKGTAGMESTPLPAEVLTGFAPQDNLSGHFVRPFKLASLDIDHAGGDDAFALFERTTASGEAAGFGIFFYRNHNEAPHVDMKTVPQIPADAPIGKSVAPLQWVLAATGTDPSDDTLTYQWAAKDALGADVSQYLNSTTGAQSIFHMPPTDAHAQSSWTQFFIASAFAATADTQWPVSVVVNVCDPAGACSENATQLDNTPMDQNSNAALVERSVTPDAGVSNSAATTTNATPSRSTDDATTATTATTVAAAAATHDSPLTNRNSADTIATAGTAERVNSEAHNSTTTPRSAVDAGTLSVDHGTADVPNGDTLPPLQTVPHDNTTNDTAAPAGAFAMGGGVGCSLIMRR